MNQRLNRQMRIGLLRDSIREERLEECIKAGEELVEIYPHVHSGCILKIVSHPAHFIASGSGEAPDGAKLPRMVFDERSRNLNQPLKEQPTIVFRFIP